MTDIDTLNLQAQIDSLQAQLATLQIEAITPIVAFEVDEGGTLPTRAHSEDAGWDLRAAAGRTIPSGAIRLVPTRVRVDLPAGTYGMICSRSGLVANQGVAVANAPGIIDSGYTGEILVSLINHGRNPFHVEAGSRIAQIVFGRTDAVSVVGGGGTLESAARGTGGHGSSGR